MAIMKKTYATPTIHVMTIDESSSMLAASAGSKQGLFENEDGYSQTGVSDYESVKGSDVLAKPRILDDDLEDQY